MSFETHFGWSLFSALALATAAAAGQEPTPVRLVVEEEIVGEARPNTLDPSFSMSSDGKRYGYLACSFGIWRQMVNSLTLGRGVNNGNCEVVVEGRVFGPYGGAGQVRFSDDGAHYFFVAAPSTRHLDETFMIVMDGTEGPLHEGTIGPPVLSADGKRIAFAADVEGARVFVDEAASPRWDYVYTNQPFFCGDASSIAYAAKTKDGWAVVADGVVQAGSLNDEMGAVRCLRDGTILYTFRRKKEHFAAVGSDVRGPYEDVRWMELSPDREHYSYVAKLGKKREIVVHDGEASREFEEIIGTVTRPHRVAILAKVDKRVSVQLGEQQSPEWDEILFVNVSPDGEHLAVIGKRKKKLFLWRRGIESPLDGSLDYVTFSPDGQHLLTLFEEKDGLRVAIDGAPSDLFSKKEGHVGMPPEWIDDDTAVAYGRNGATIVRRTFRLAR